MARTLRPRLRGDARKTDRRFLLAIAALLGSATLAHAEDITIKIGQVKSITSVVNLWAMEKGYLKGTGIKLEIQDLDTSANNIALLAQNQFQVIEGGISAGYFNALEKNLPIAIVMDRVTSPLGHNVMLRPDLKGKITDLKQLKGKVVATNGQGAVSTYEVGKMLETAGISIEDVDVKILPFPQMAIAFRNKAIDAAIVIPPFRSVFLDRGDAVDFKDPDDLVKPFPLTIAVSMVNTDWAKAHPQAARDYYRAYLHAARDYCNAYHGGKERQPMIDLLRSSGTETRSAILNKYPWPARNPDGHISTASMLDMQAWFTKHKMANSHFGAERLVNASFVEEAVKTLGPFKLENPQSKLQGCR